jgi:23S rRNA (adenine2503-C2)-methyltransferase
MSTEPNLFGMDLARLEAAVEALGEPRFRASQIYAWLYAKRARAIADMTDLSEALRRRLGEAYALAWPEVAERALSYDGSRKYLFRLHDGATIEAVFIPEQRRRTICISTQAGCPLKCAFCLTGIAGYRRNLTPGEILGQVAAVMAEATPRATPWNVVVMGMGEPLLNCEASVLALRVLMDPRGFAIAPRRLTLSTVGILPALERLGEEQVRPNLAISLHASNPELRRRLMPIEDKYPLPAVIAAASRYAAPRGGRVTYEYVLLGGVNDRPQEARELVRLLSGAHAKVNLIPLNPASEIPFAAPTEADIDRFCRILVDGGLSVSVRRSRGQDILAACGQLHLKRGAGPAAGRRD